MCEPQPSLAKTSLSKAKGGRNLLDFFLFRYVDLKSELIFFISKTLPLSVTEIQAVARWMLLLLLLLRSSKLLLSLQ